MICKTCGAKMHLDDVDYNFKGNQNNYWICSECKTTCFEKIRYHKSIYKEFHERED